MTHTVNFKRLAQGLDIQPLLDAVSANPELWNAITVRQDHTGSAHKDTRAIYLRGPFDFTFKDYFMTVEAYDYPLMDELKDVLVPLLSPVLKELGVTELGYVMLVELKPGGHVKKHIDQGKYADHYCRFHVAITGEQGATLTVGGESQHFDPGELWWFNHKTMHYADNKSETPRIHLIFDAVTTRLRCT